MLKLTAIALIWKAYFDYEEFRLICEFQAFQRAPKMLLPAIRSTSAITGKFYQFTATKDTIDKKQGLDFE